MRIFFLLIFVLFSSGCSVDTLALKPNQSLKYSLIIASINYLDALILEKMYTKKTPNKN
jgi:hypothetical protein